MRHETRNEKPNEKPHDKQDRARGGEVNHVNLPAWIVRWKNRRALDRDSDPGVDAFFWDGGNPRSNRVRDISLDGAYVETNGRWYIGTIIFLTLQPVRIAVASRQPVLLSKLSTVLPIYRPPAATQKTEKMEKPEKTDQASSVMAPVVPDPVVSDPVVPDPVVPDNGTRTLRVSCRVVRPGVDGIGVQFLTDRVGRKTLRKFLDDCNRAHEQHPEHPLPKTAAAPRVRLPLDAAPTLMLALRQRELDGLRPLGEVLR